MRRKWFNKQLVISLLFFFAFIGAVVVNELNLLKKFTTTPVVMAAGAIDKDTMITEDMIYIQQMPKELVTQQMFHAAGDVVGKTATQLILPNQYVAPVALDNSILRPTAEHEFFPIPDSWLVGIQGTLRRYDIVNISAVLASNDNAVTRNIKGNYVLEEVPVAYVKDSRNGEVTGATNNNDRLNETSRPSSVQLSLKLEDFKVLEQLVLDGYRLIISY
ncbi:SAF domain-containing protein [Cytobacillus gottheilii]|uniref:SAF domain-containing protein n=1 Tax=Cytobacillus gottheilii TaxID=859144 RepID=UPI00249520A5|nr:SAF domain-containing protein [Cytobacillus gottheilii]